MIRGALLGLLLTASAGAGSAPPRVEDRLPARVDVRYRMELAGEHVGWARLAVSCAAGRCRATWESALRPPDPSDVLSRRIDIEAEPTGRALRVRVSAGAAAGGTRRSTAGPGSVPASLAELLLAGAAEGARRCVRVRDEESGREGDACARRQGAWLEGEVLGEPIRFRAAPGQAPEEVLLPAQRARFVADAAAGLPARAPRLFGTAVRAPAGSPPRLCGVRLDAVPPEPLAGLPRSFPDGASCRERTARYLEIAAREGLRGRHAIGVAFDGREFVWHEWAELLAGGRWIPIDPSFEQVPAKGPRFTIARFEDSDPAARAEAARRVLACWSSAGSG